MDVTFWYSTRGFLFMSATWTAARYQSSRECIYNCRHLKVMDRFYLALCSRKRKSCWCIYISRRNSLSLVKFLAMDCRVVFSFLPGRQFFFFASSSRSNIELTHFPIYRGYHWSLLRYKAATSKVNTTHILTFSSYRTVSNQHRNYLMLYS